MEFSRLPAPARRAFQLDALSGIIGGAYVGGILPFLGVIARKELQAGPMLLAVMSAAPFLGFLASIYWAKRAERVSRVKLVADLALVARGFLLLLAYAASAPIFVLLTTAALIIPGFGSPAYASIMQAVYPEAWRGRLVSLVRIGITLSSMLVAAAVGLLLEHWSFRLLFPMLSAISMIGLLVFRRIQEPPREAAPAAAPADKISLRVWLRQNPGFARFTLGFFLFGWGNLIYMPAVPILQVDVLKITPQWVGLLATIATFFSGISYYYWGKLVDRRGAISCTLLACAGWLMVVVGYIFVPNLGWLIPVAVVTGFAGAAQELAMLNGMLYFCKDRNLERYTGVHYTLLGIRGLGAPLLGGWLIGKMPLRGLFVLGAGLIFLGLLLLLGLRGEKCRS
jgi:MFS family permease